jgi:preprotein translocase subunit SecY
MRENMNWKIIWKSLRKRDMQKRLLAVLGIVLVYKVLAHIPIPLGNGETIKQVISNLFETTNSTQLLSYINVLSGGALANFSIMIAGLGPYINASIIMQLLTKAIPQLEALQAAQSIGGVGDITANSTIQQWVLMVAALTAGSMLLMWLGELITEQSIGNGISLLITVSIVSALPQTISNLYQAAFSGSTTWTAFGHTFHGSKTAAIHGAIIILAIVLITWIVVKLNEAARNVTVNYAKRVQGNRTYGGVTTVLPIKLITAGVVPIIFAVAFLSVPTFAGQLLANNSSARLQGLGTNLVTWFQSPSAATFAAGGWQPYIYPVVYFLLVVVFTYFYTSIAFNSKEIAENLQKQGGFIEGVRGGDQTEKFLARTVNRLTLFGAISLGILALLPIIAQVFLTSTNITIGGTSVLILVSVSLQTLRAVESRALMVTYDQYSEPDYFKPQPLGGENMVGITGGATYMRFLPKPFQRKPKK